MRVRVVSCFPCVYYIVLLRWQTCGCSNVRYRRNSHTHTLSLVLSSPHFLSHKHTILNICFFITILKYELLLYCHWIYKCMYVYIRKLRCIYGSPCQEIHFSFTQEIFHAQQTLQYWFDKSIINLIVKVHCYIF